MARDLGATHIDLEWYLAKDLAKIINVLTAPDTTED